MDDEALQRGLRKLLAPSDDEASDCSAMLYRQIAGPVSLEEAAAFRAHLEVCAECQADLQQLRSLAARPARRAASWPRPWLVAPAAVVLLVALGLPLMLRRDARVRGGVAEQPFRLKGGFRVHLAVKRGESRFVARSGDQFRAGDALGFFYSGPKPAFLALFFSDEKGQITRLNPDSMRVRAGAQVALPDGAVLEPGSGCEWIVAGFFERSPDPEQLEAALWRAVRHRSPDCRLSFVFPRSLATQVFVLRR